MARGYDHSIRPVFIFLQRSVQAGPWDNRAIRTRRGVATLRRIFNSVGRFETLATTIFPRRLTYIQPSVGGQQPSRRRRNRLA